VAIWGGGVFNQLRKENKGMLVIQDCSSKALGDVWIETLFAGR